MMSLRAQNHRQAVDLLNEKVIPAFQQVATIANNRRFVAEVNSNLGSLSVRIDVRTTDDERKIASTFWIDFEGDQPVGTWIHQIGPNAPQIEKGAIGLFTPGQAYFVEILEGQLDVLMR